MNPKISIVIPFHWMHNWQFFLSRCLQSIEKQTFKDYEVILAKVSTMPITSNRVMESAKGELVKILYMDDFLAHENSLKEIVEHFTDDCQWMASACLHVTDGEITPHSPHYPHYTDDIAKGNNDIGSPSVMTFRREGMLFFDEKLSWLLDCDLYKRYYDIYGLPTILNDLNVVIGVGGHQTTYALTDEEKLTEHKYVEQKHA